ncbi:MAG TPA: hypothetical protein VMH27_20535 [Puia sp.]|nr:hypothetical protein [Puia sp.]
MTHRLPFVVIAACLLFSAACKKSNNNGNAGPNPLTGTSWNVEGETTSADVTSTATFGPLSVTVINLIDFHTIDNTGTISFTSDSLNATGVGYSIDTSYTSITQTPVSSDTIISPLATTVPPGNASFSYKLIGQDSIYFPNGSPIALNVDSIQPPIEAKGAHFTINGTTLTITSTINQSGNETVNGITAPTTGTIRSVITLSKQ